MGKSILIALTFLLLLPLSFAELYDDFSETTLNTTRWAEGVGSSISNAYFDEHFVTKGVYYTAQNSPADRSVKLMIANHSFQPGDVVELDVNYAYGTDNRLVRFVLDGSYLDHDVICNGNCGGYATSGGIGCWGSRSEVGNEYGIYHIRIEIYDVNSTAIITRPDGSVWQRNASVSPNTFGIESRTGGGLLTASYDNFIINPYCGDGLCGYGENCFNCSADCGCGAGKVCYNSQEMYPETEPYYSCVNPSYNIAYGDFEAGNFTGWKLSGYSTDTSSYYSATGSYDVNSSICSNGEIFCNSSCSLPACYLNLDCNDKKPLTIDSCQNPGTCNATCSNVPCTVACSADSDCNDSNALTIDSCQNPGTCSASCSNTPITTCTNNDGYCPSGCNLETDNDCSNCPSGKLNCNGLCKTPICSLNTDCNDNNIDTIDLCIEPAKCDAYCEHNSISCSGEKIKCNTICVTPLCFTDSNCNDNNSSTQDLCNNPGTCNASCSNTPCLITCSDDLDCGDSNSLTIDACSNPGTCSASCSNVPCAVGCSTDAGCDDGNSLTNDYCLNPNTCEASCLNIPYTIECSADSDCDDSNILTIDTCNNAGTRSASCSNTPCSVACSNDLDCNDNNSLTVDSCLNPGTCNAACTSTYPIACYLDSDCNDNNSNTQDICNNFGTCNASCSNIDIIVDNDINAPDFNSTGIIYGFEEDLNVSYSLFVNANDSSGWNLSLKYKIGNGNETIVYNTTDSANNTELIYKLPRGEWFELGGQPIYWAYNLTDNDDTPESTGWSQWFEDTTLIGVKINSPQNITYNRSTVNFNYTAYNRTAIECLYAVKEANSSEEAELINCTNSITGLKRYTSYSLFMLVHNADNDSFAGLASVLFSTGNIRRVNITAINIVQDYTEINIMNKAELTLDNITYVQPLEYFFNKTINDKLKEKIISKTEEMVKDVKISRNINSNPNNSTVLIVINNTGNKKSENFVIIETIPKDIAYDTSELNFLTAPTEIISDDPIIMWVMNISKGEVRDITYTVNKEITNEISQEYETPVILEISELTAQKEKKQATKAQEQITGGAVQETAKNSSDLLAILLACAGIISIFFVFSGNSLSKTKKAIRHKNTKNKKR